MERMSGSIHVVDDKFYPDVPASGPWNELIVIPRITLEGQEWQVLWNPVGTIDEAHRNTVKAVENFNRTVDYKSPLGVR